MAEMSTSTSDAPDSKGETPEPSANEPDQTPEGFKSPESKEAVLADLKRERDARKAAEKKIQEFEDAQKTDLEKLTGRAERAEATASTLEAENARLRVAISKGLPVDLVDRLKGDSEDELAEDADKLLALVAPPQTDTQAPGPRPDRSQGASGTGALPLNGDPLLNDLKTKLGIR